ncbi:MAG: hypothetical protein H7145_16645 [Akkermansiaceae bacterium]|nr:hypothetical protein [Armatimonadota bacterium]
MQQINPKDRPKLIALIVAVVLVVGFGVKTTTDTLSTVSGTTLVPVATPTAAAAAAVAPDSAVATTTPEVPSNTFVLRNTYYDKRGRDPFTPVADSEFAKYSVKISGLVVPPPPPPSAPIVTGNTNVFGRNTFKEFRQGLDSLNARNNNLSQLNKEMSGVGASPVLPAPTFKILPPPPPPYTVVGVLIGEAGGRDVAILSRNAGTDKKFVVTGDALEGGYTVTAIESGGVRVMHPGRRSTTAAIPNAAPVPVGGSTEYYLPKQTTVVPATSVTLPLEGESKTGTPGAK